MHVSVPPFGAGKVGHTTGVHDRNLLHCSWELQAVTTGPAADDTNPGLQSKVHTLDVLRCGHEVPHAARPAHKQYGT